MKDLIVSLFGTYSAITYNNGTSDVIPDGLSGVDFEWCAGVFLFALTLYCVFRLLGGIMKHVIGD